jgi:LPPG:FO 2-phospho-L-lactate transferase
MEEDPKAVIEQIKVVACAGGVGGARLADGLAAVLPSENLTVIVNTGDDFEYLGLRICPDLDTVCYTLAGLANPVTGWGRAAESFNTLENLVQLGGPGWFRLGDQDLGTHLERTRRLRLGQTLSQVTQAFCQAWGVQLTVLPMSDQFTPTWVYTDEGELPFQEYFVHRQCRPKVSGFYFEGIEMAKPAPGVMEALESASLVVLCPSNPWVSIDPILAVPGMRAKLETKKVVAVSPIIGGQTVKGPAAKMYTEMGIEPSAQAVANHYRDILSGFVIDRVDEGMAVALQSGGLPVYITDTVMRTRNHRQHLARQVLEFGLSRMLGGGRLPTAHPGEPG